LSYVAIKAPNLVTTDEIARQIEDHPARVRQLVATLVKADLLVSVRGANGGVKLARDADEIDLRQVYEAVADQPLVSIAWKDPHPTWANNCHIQPNFERLSEELETKAMNDLASYRLSEMFTR
jgi:Rrf2 family protein